MRSAVVAVGTLSVLAVATLGLALLDPACTPSSSSPLFCSGRPVSTEIDFPCTLWLPKATVSGPCAYDGIVTIFASGTPGTCSVELEFSNGFKYATTIEYTQEGASGPCPYVVPSVDHIKVGFPLCGEDGGNACVMSCGCVDSYDAAGTIFVDAGRSASGARPARTMTRARAQTRSPMSFPMRRVGNNVGSTAPSR